VHEALARGPDFVLIDVRSPELFAHAHVPGAINIPHAKIIAARMACYAPGTLFVVYCAGPHCNGAERGALRLARLGLPVKVMIGGMTGWLDEGFDVEQSAREVHA
jgi:rhodanese-related sulfurtransferase